MFTLRSFSTTLWFLLLTTTLNHAALPPQVQDAKDLAVMQAFVDTHKKVSSTLKHIDIYNYKVHYGKACVASFERAFSFHLPGWVGPASPLVFKSATCPID